MEWLSWVTDADVWASLVMLGMAFLILIGVVLVREEFGRHVERGYIYFAMAFATVVEMLNLRVRSKQRE
jgi:predicted tellurium resistance membrane protein TerC